MVICVIESTSTCICFAFVCTIVALHLLLKKNVALKNKFIYGFLYFISANMMKFPDKINSISFHQKALNRPNEQLFSYIMPMMTMSPLY
jgi:hypothetical protein